MSAVTARRRPPPATRRVGYGVAAAVNVVLLYLINGHPGWSVIPFLTGDMAQIVALVNVSLIVGLVVELAELAYDPPWLVAVGGLVTTAIGLAVLVRIWQVFPLDFGDAPFDGAMIARVLLAVGMVGAAISFVVQAVALVRAVRHPRSLASADRP